MNAIQRITKNVSVLFISQMLSYVFSFFTLIYTARYLGVQGYGILSLALAFTSIFTVLMDLGLNTLIVREIARDKTKTKTYVANITSIKIVLSIFTFIFIVVIANILGYNQETLNILYLITFYTIFNTFSLMFYGVFQAYEKMEYKSLGVILSGFFVLCGVLIAEYYKFNIIQFSLIYGVSGALIFAFSMIIYSRKFSLTKLHYNKVLWKKLLKESWPFAITGMSLSIYAKIDTLILSQIQGVEEVGLYTASYSLSMTLLFIPIVFNNAFFPTMSRYFITSKESLNLTFEKLLKIMALIAIPLGVGTVFVSDKVIPLIYGNSFNGSIFSLQILIWSTVLIFLRSPFERLLEASNRQLVVTKIFIISTIFNTGLNIVLISLYGFIGAAVVNVLTDTLVLVILLLIVKSIKIVTLPNNMQTDLLKIILASIIMGIILYQIKSFNLFLMILIGVIIYIVMVIFFKILNEDEIKMIKTIFRR